MSLLAPLGLLGLLSIAALILIYVLKPNYQQKIISSTYVWKLSLRYKKKRIPISRFTNILIFICQFLILVALAFVMSKPVIPGKMVKSNEKVFIIDASANMLVSYADETRFERAVQEVQDEIADTFEDGGLVTVIVANEDPYTLAQRSRSADSSVIKDRLDELIDREIKCTYGSADLEKAVALAQGVVDQNPDAEVYLYTATTYVDKGNIEVVDVSDMDDWNAAILGVDAVIGDDNYYTITVRVGCYGRSESMQVIVEVEGANGEPTPYILESDELFFNVMEEEQTVTFDAQVQIDQEGDGNALHSFKSLYVHVDEADGFEKDNAYYFYGGEKDTIKIQYASSAPNNFFRTAVYTLREVYKNTWNIQFDEVTIDLRKPVSEQEYALEEYDFYIFEHTMPEKLPTDGIVMLVDPDSKPKGLEMTMGGMYGLYESPLTAGDPHPLTAYMNPEAITITKFTEIVTHNGFDELMYYGNKPVLLAKNDMDSKVIVMAFDLNYSNFSMLFDFPTFFFNIFNYYMPPTLTDYGYEIGDTVYINARGDSLTLTGGEFENESFTSFPAQVIVNQPGTYTVAQVSMTGEYIIDNFFVGISNYESNITKEIEALPFLSVIEREDEEDKDLIIWFAAVMVALLFLEWGLQARKHF
ncbi:MAG: VWA domain-containing protein [Clostridia bacterium]|nr:VWA domain-containing protein [Clostridia bacterium]